MMQKKIITHHYLESGLKNVYLEGVKEFICPKCKESYIDIPSPELIHIIIALVISSKEGMLSGEEIRFMRKELGMTGKAFAHFIGVSPITLSRWENDSGSANKSEAHDRLIRFAFKIMICERLRIMVSWLENQIENKKVASLARRRLEINAAQLGKTKIPKMLRNKHLML